MIIKQLPTGPLAVNCFIVGDLDTKEAIVIDPGGSVDNIVSALAEHELQCKIIFNTHTHFDHIGGNADLKDITGAELITHPKEAPFLQQADQAALMFGLRTKSSPPADRTVVEGDTIVVGKYEGVLVEIPGHSPCGLALIFPGHAFVGDALFAGGIGRTDFPGGSHDALIGAIRDKLYTLPDDTIVYPGHGPNTTIGHEKRTNPWVHV
ncbi:MAG: MBL fold metallo-hydrolase [Candidatus Lernaella stagnicola]|nr:MBL fold metallo-hydrolase [Candidatus Lernaella stagnicola]